MIAILSFRRLFARRARGFAAALVLSLVALCAGVALLGVSGWFLTAAFLSTAAASFNLFGPSAAVRGLSFLRIGARYGEKLAGHDATLRLLADIREWVFRSLSAGALQNGRLLRRGDAVSRLTADVDALDSVFIVAAGPLISSALVSLATAAALALLLPGAAAPYGVAMAAALVVAPTLLVLATRRLGAEIVRLSAEARTAALDAIDGHADLILFGAAETAKGRSAAIFASLATARRRLAFRSAIASASVFALAGGGAIGVLAVGLHAHEAGEIGGPRLVGLLLAALGSFEATAALVRSIAKFGGAAAAAERLKAIGDASPSVRAPERPQPFTPDGSIAFEQVTFGYDAERPVLRDLDLTVAPGERVSVEGASGAGKSTLACLLMRLADPDQGGVRLAGRDLRTIAEPERLASVALLEQNAPIFQGTVRDNLAIGGPDASDEQMWEALARARVADVVRALPGGLDAELGEAGTSLSAGEGRRLCLARVLLSRAPTLLLDEPTSGLDRETELAFLKDLSAATRGRAVLLITHADLPDGVVDRRLRLREGRLVPATS
ncbi:thiol reductant ABC exporter subunit CydC [Hansschlegelia sp. KR7-227]|uniref:thiol reductant ABC exporter subunit CydC n=1 Tax=Hansschlegelia sp. KR7-227 TaxID=3400914 RepID=UPI003C0F1C62